MAAGRGLQTHILDFSSRFLPLGFCAKTLCAPLPHTCLGPPPPPSLILCFLICSSFCSHLHSPVTPSSRLGPDVFLIHHRRMFLLHNERSCFPPLKNNREIIIVYFHLYSSDSKIYETTYCTKWQ